MASNSNENPHFLQGERLYQLRYYWHIGTKKPGFFWPGYLFYAKN
tara:strand:+ start:836 stop:970 length:135 start_codon:yes stop_codon:yes gene_type:complete